MKKILFITFFLYLTSAIYSQDVNDFILNGRILTSYIGDATDVVIPREFGISEIGRAAFRNNVNIISITIPEGVTFIDEFAFAGCRNLTSITLPSSISRFRSGIFNNSNNITSITLPENFNRIDMFAQQYSDFEIIYGAYHKRGGTYELINNQWYYNESLLETPAQLLTAIGFYVVSINGNSPSSYYGRTSISSRNYFYQYYRNTLPNIPSGINEFFKGTFYLPPGLYTIEVVNISSNNGRLAHSTISELRLYFFGKYSYNLTGEISGNQIIFSIERVNN